MKSLAQQIEPIDRGQSSAEWLVSVRDASELAEAIRFGVDVIDLKEPSRGALAPVNIKVWEQAVNWLLRSAAGETPALPRLSAALGEREDAELIASQVPPQFSFAKAGISHCATPEAVRRLWTNVAGKLDSRVELVAVAYADAAAAQCVEIETVLSETNRAGRRRCLIDTFGKDGRSSLHHLGLERLAEFDATAKRLGIWWALAGSIKQADVAVLAARGISPNCYAVRGDVCDQDRTGAICPQRMQAWSERLATGP